MGRGVYRMAQLADQRYRDAHRKAAKFVGCTGQEGMTIFTRNTTESINIVASGLQWKKGERIVTTLLEHHSNLLPWMRLREKGVELQVIKPDQTGMIDPAEYEKAITKGTRLVAVSQLSNALGTVLPVKEIGKICRERGAALLVDGAQSAPHMPIDVKDIDCDFLCFSGHKMLAPMGTGVLWIKKEGEVEPLLVGGGMVQDVGEDGYDIKKGYEGFEAGTPDISAGIGLGAAVDYLTRVGVEDIHHHEQSLTEKLLKGLAGDRRGSGLRAGHRLKPAGARRRGLLCSGRPLASRGGSHARPGIEHLRSFRPSLLHSLNEASRAKIRHRARLALPL